MQNTVPLLYDEYLADVGAHAPAAVVVAQGIKDGSAGGRGE